MTNSSPPLSPLSSGPVPAQAPKLPHSIIAAAHCLAPLDDLHLAHLVNALKPPPPVWSIYDGHPSRLEPGPLIESNDRLRSDELADLPAPEAERLHATYDIEDHLDCTPDRLLVYGPSAPLTQVLEDVKDLLLSASNTQNPIKNSAIPSSSSQISFLKLNGCNDDRDFGSMPAAQALPHVYVARLWFQPKDGPDGSYRWSPGGSDLIKFELDGDDQLVGHEDQQVIINWSSVEVALSQALEVGHQLLALLHSRQFKELLESIDRLSEFRPINPIVWLVDPVEYAHAQLRETTEWGWSEHHVELNPSHSSLRSYSSRPPSNLSTTSAIREPSCTLSKSQLRQELCSIDEDRLPFSPDSYTLGLLADPPFYSCQSRLAVRNQVEDLSSWLDDLLDRRLPRLLSLPGGCLSYELLKSTQPSNSSSQHIPSNLGPKLPSLSLASPPDKSDDSPDDGAPSTTSKVISINNHNLKWTPTISALGSPVRPFGFDQRSVANSVPSFDQHYIPSPGISTRRHGQTNTLRYYPCKACAEHAFKLALSHKLDEEKRRLPRAMATRPPKSLSHVTHKRGSRNGSADCLSSFGAVIDGQLASSGGDGTNQIARSVDCHHPNSSGNYPVIGLGLKGKALKEAMDREDDEFLKTRNLLSSRLELHSQHLSLSSSKHAWDEGEAVED